MKTAGGLLLVCGIVLLFIALNLETSVSTYIPPTSIYSSETSGSVNNIGLMQKQMMTFQAGLAAILAGAIFLSGGSLVDAINPPPKEEPQPVATATPPPPPPPESVEPRVKRSPEEMAAEERQMWIWVGATIAAAVGLMLVVALLVADSGRRDAASGNLLDRAPTANSLDSLINQAEIDATENSLN
jgi:hypothetical protein